MRYALGTLPCIRCGLEYRTIPEKYNVLQYVLLWTLLHTAVLLHTAAAAAVIHDDDDDIDVGACATAAPGSRFLALFRSRRTLLRACP